MVLAAVRMASSRRSRSRSAESEAPMALSCSRRWPRSSAALAATSAKRKPWVDSRAVLTGREEGRALLDGDRAHFLHVGDAHQAFLHAVLLERAHAVLEALGEHFGHARVLLDQLLQLVGGDEQLVQAAAALEARSAALVAADDL